MSARQDWTSLRIRVAGKWQAPLLVGALALFAATIYRTRPDIPPIPFKDALAQIDSAIGEGRFAKAIQAARELGARKEVTIAQRGQIELRLGRARFGALAVGPVPQASVARQVVRHFQVACEGLSSPPLMADDFISLGRLAQWQNDEAGALDHFQRAIELGSLRADDLRKDIYLIHRDRLQEEPRQLAAGLQDMLASIATHRHDLRIWCLEEMLELAERQGDIPAAQTFLDKEVAVFEGSDLQPQFEFLRCRLLVMAGEVQEAEVRLRTLRNQVDPSSDVSAMAGWLLGRVLAESDSEAKWNEALSFFADVLKQQARGPYAVASVVGQGAVLAKLGRHDEAIASFSTALKELGSLGDHRVIDLYGLRGSLAVTAEGMRQKDDLGHARQYAALAGQLTDSGTDAEKTLFYQALASIEEQWADQLSADGGKYDAQDRGVGEGTFEAGELYGLAAKHFDDLSRWTILDERRSADFEWRAAGLWAKSGKADEAITRYRDFVTQRPGDHRGPTALIHVGQIRFSRGQFAQAVEAFEECHRRYPHSFDGARALVPLARTYMAMGREKLGNAEQALREVLDDSDVFTPEAGEFAESLFLLGDVLERDERYEPAIIALTEALERYPDDPRAPRGRFLLGGAYRKSALALRELGRESQAPVDLGWVGQESKGRFRAARREYRKVIDDLELRAAGELDEQARLYLRHSYLYEADCLFETHDYADALRLYEEAAGNLRDSARGLSAHVQMINCHVFLGNQREAKAALARALVAIRSMPDNAFVNRVAPESREEWTKYFEWLGASELF